MADEKVQEEQEGQEKKGGKLKLIIIILIALIVLGGGGFAAYMFLFKKSPPPAAPKGNATAQQAAQQVAPPVKKEKILPQIQLDPFIVNLADKNARRYLKLTVALEMSNEKLKDEIEKRKAEIRDRITTLLRLKTASELSTYDGTIALKTEIMNRLNAILITGRVTNVFFVDFVIQ